MEDYIGIDVSMKETALSIRRGGQRVWRGKCVSDPQRIAQIIRKHGPSATRIVFETGPLSVWFYHALRAEGLPAICIDARHAKAALNMAANKTDQTMRMDWHSSLRWVFTERCALKVLTACWHAPSWRREPSWSE